MPYRLLVRLIAVQLAGIRIFYAPGIDHYIIKFENLVNGVIFIGIIGIHRRNGCKRPADMEILTIIALRNSKGNMFMTADLADSNRWRCTSLKPRCRYGHAIDLFCRRIRR